MWTSSALPSFSKTCRIPSFDVVIRETGRQPVASSRARIASPSVVGSRRPRYTSCAALAVGDSITTDSFAW